MDWPRCNDLITIIAISGNFWHNLGMEKEKLKQEDFKEVGDIIYYDGPLLTLFADKRGSAWIQTWLDEKDGVMVWGLIKLADGMLEPLLRSEKTVHEAYSDALYIGKIIGTDWTTMVEMSVQDFLLEYGPDVDLRLDNFVENPEGLIKKFVTLSLLCASCGQSKPTPSL